MYLSFVQGHKNGERVKNIEVHWWSPDKLQSKYTFEEVMLGGELDFHLTVSSAQLKEILENKHFDSSYAKFCIDTPAMIAQQANIIDQIEDLIAHAEEYDELKIVLFYWQSMGGAF